MGIYAWLPKILNMSLTASVTIPVILLARLLLKRAPKIFSYVLWSVVLFRLLCPVTFSSSVSLLGIFDTAATETGSMEYIPANIGYAGWEEETRSVGMTGTGAGAEQTEPVRNIGKASTGSAKPHVRIATYVWICGMVLILLYSGISLFLLRRRLVGAVCIRNHIYETDYVASPFVIGILRPRIYLPSTLGEKERDYILLHERTHIRRGDHIVKLLFFAALVIHWFNPLVWLAFRLMEKDMEMSCDEAVMKHMEGDIRAEYSQSLLGLATGKNRIAGTPLAFGEGDTKARIKNVMRYHRPAILVLVLAIAVVIVLLLVLGSNPGNDSIEDENTIVLKNLGAGADTEEQEWESLLQEFEAQQAIVQQEIDSLQEEIEQLQIQYELAKNDAADTEKQQELERRIEELEEQKAVLQQKLVRLQEESGQLEEENTLLPEESGQLQEQYQLAENWAKAFCSRDGAAIVSMSSETLQDSLMEQELLAVGDGYGAFGWSSPWPWDSENDYTIVTVTETSAEILYYAWVSDPHITVWREKIAFHIEENGEGLVDWEKLEMLDYICAGDVYEKAYPNGITGTRMNYLTNGAGEILNQNAVSNQASEFYARLFAPESAAVYLLNLLDNPNKVEVTAGKVQEDESVPVTIHFMEDDGYAVVYMIQPYGEEGIWIPHTKTTGTGETESGNDPEDTLSGIYEISVRSISGNGVESYVADELKEGPDGSPISFADECIFKVNKSMSAVEYEEVSYDTFAAYIAQGLEAMNRPCRLTMEDGKITEICLKSAYYRYGISYDVLVNDQEVYDEYQLQQEVAGDDLLEVFYTLDGRMDAEVADSPGRETIEVYTGNIGDGKSGYVFIKDEEGTVLYNIFAHTARAGWKSVYLGENENGAFLMTLHVEDREDYGEYYYHVFRLGENGEMEQMAGSCFAWGDIYLYDDDLFREWVKEMEGYLEDSALLLSSQDGIIRTEHVSDADRYNYETLGLAERR